MTNNNGQENLILFLESLQAEADSIHKRSYDLVTQLFNLPIRFHLAHPDLIAQARVSIYTNFQTLSEFYTVLEELQNADNET